MKLKKNIKIPDGLYESFGILLPLSEQEDGEDYVHGSSITEHIGRQRINTLQRESKYRTYYPILKEINLLTLNYPVLPLNPHERIQCVRKAIRKNIIKVLSALSPTKELNEACLDYINGVLSFYGDFFHAVLDLDNGSSKARLVNNNLGTTGMVCITFPELGGAKAYDNPFSKKAKREKYTRWRDDPSSLVHIIDLVGLLSDISLIQSMHYILKNIQIPVIQDIFKVYSEPHESLQKHQEDDILTEFISTKAPMPARHLIHHDYEKHSDYFSVGSSYRLSAKLIELFCKVLEIYQDIHYENGHRDKINKSIATAYMTKKNIPRSVLAAMDDTDFKKYFKYVEFDEDVDLESVKVIEKEFKVLNRAYFSSKAFFDVKLRFRKLGKHKASGLYYPALRTLCVDLRSPSSFIHEYFHMIDDQLGDPSLGTAFQDIVEEYKRGFLKGMEKSNDAVKEKLNGRSKYNLQYYFRRAEIFARCGEIYFVRILKVESSLIKPDLMFAYPESERLDNLIKNYYEDLLNVKLAQSSFANVG